MSNIDRKFTPLELKFVEKNKTQKPYKMAGNLRSEDTYVLNKKPFENIKKELDLRIKDYFEKIISPKDNIQPYITQSWITYTNKNEWHHKHAHPNALVSGVLYINSDENFDKIKFFNEGYKTIRTTIKEYNIFNSESWWFPVKTGDIIMFPSSLTHMVETKDGDNTRICLAFNVFIKGKFGSKDEIFELVL